MAVSNDNLFLDTSRTVTPKPANSTSAVTKISELVEYVLLPHNDDVVKPRALKTFIDGLAELGINKRLIQNKRMPIQESGQENANPIAIKTVRLVIKKWSPKAVIMKMTQTASEYSEHQESENPDMEPEG